MRALPLACLLLTLATSAFAEDRYGPQRNGAAGAASFAPVARLSWPGKVAPAVIEAAQEPDLPRPLADGSLRRTSVYENMPLPVPPTPPAAAPPAPAVVADAGAPPAENAPWRRLTSISAPRPTANPPAMDDAAATPEARPTTPVATPGRLPAAQPYPASTTERASAATGDQARYYSLHREYGETPDAIPTPEKSQVFLAGGPLNSGVGEGDEAPDSEGTGRTAETNKARLAAEWGSSSAR